jgi:aminomethyltransferase
MTNFGGWDMPLQYSSIREEHQAVRQAVGLFDLSHMGELELSAPGARELAELVLTNEVASLKPGRARYSMICDERGGIIDDLLVYAQEEGYLLVVNAANQDRDYEWVRSHAGNTAVRNIGRQTALIGVQGPRALELVQRLADVELQPVRYYAFVEGKVGGIPCRVSRTGYTGEDGFELFCTNPQARTLWSLLLEEGRSFGIKPAGLGARDTLRLEAAMRLYGNDMDRQTNPLEAGLDWAVKLEKEFIGRDALLGARDRGLERILSGLKMLDQNIARHGYPILLDGKRVGTVASGNVSFTLGYNIAMGYVPPELSRLGTRVAVEVRGVAAPAEVVQLPFYIRPGQKRKEH